MLEDRVLFGRTARRSSRPLFFPLMKLSNDLRMQWNSIRPLTLRGLGPELDVWTLHAKVAVAPSKVLNLPPTQSRPHCQEIDRPAFHSTALQPLDALGRDTSQGLPDSCPPPNDASLLDWSLKRGIKELGDLSTGQRTTTVDHSNGAATDRVDTSKDIVLGPPHLHQPLAETSYTNTVVRLGPIRQHGRHSRRCLKLSTTLRQLVDRLGHHDRVKITKRDYSSGPEDLCQYGPHLADVGFVTSLVAQTR